MAWEIKCTDRGCGRTTSAQHIVDLISNHRDATGWLLCECGSRGYVEKSYSLQEGGDPWKPFIKGAIPLGAPSEIYQPFVFLVAASPDGDPDSVWISYYTDLRSSGGRLKLGHGLGGPPVLSAEGVRALMGELAATGI